MKSFLNILTIAAMFLLTPCPIIAAEPLKVIYAGFGRFGTTSLLEALTHLGYKATHGSIIGRDLTGLHANMGEALMKGDVTRLLEETSRLGYNATITSHNIYWREMMAHTPNAKIIFMMRDFEPWFDSLSTMHGDLAPLFRYPLQALPFAQRIYRYTMALMIQTFEPRGYSRDEIQVMCDDPKGELSRKAYKEQYEEYIVDMTRILKDQPQRAFLFDKNEGYPQLCRILDIPLKDCPSEKVFPHANVVKKEGRIFRALEHAAHGLIFIVIYILWRGLKGKHT
mmetsp:Transcript_19342/g.29133  ORF Transcript_19342/g.29133 Transcript_19342/m.29133 type:complete len:282 (+) Transcript_19342:218-1063(+)